MVRTQNDWRYDSQRSLVMQMRKPEAIATTRKLLYGQIEGAREAKDPGCGDNVAQAPVSVEVLFMSSQVYRWQPACVCKASSKAYLSATTANARSFACGGWSSELEAERRK